MGASGYWILGSNVNVFKRTNIRTVPDIRSITVKVDRYHTSKRLAAHAKENGPVSGGCPISSTIMVNIHGQHLYRELIVLSAAY